ncbi:hypothetical protein BURMUCF1_B0405 [Burkholderia multivorans ATCC BAA-247]|uniref:Uncharacterized protein n=1 Tax=Burkholderia multivorans CGD2 TaxID=513052 RepID=B9BPH3_9BURK|nr:hypothetical protein BURMUCGD2_6594 [Burkholderia multivorans CGD2]EEE13862.1 hypothetical protein BURMUCGD2M_6584 [Burkholderia multivorans CGD2M]EJO55610.1 hypothetical protein BURMUCF1_B0405 [Burkholderia multivorans ATCC BAA-247]
MSVAVKPAAGIGARQAGERLRECIPVPSQPAGPALRRGLRASPR